MTEEQFNKAVSSAVALLWTKRNRPEDAAAVVKVWKRVLGRNGVTVREIGDVTDQYLEESPFFPDVSEVLRWIQSRRDEKPKVGVLNPDGTVRLCLAENAHEYYREVWGEEPTRGLNYSPARELPATAKSLPEPKAKEMPPLDDPEQERRIREQIRNIQEAKSGGL